MNKKIFLGSVFGLLVVGLIAGSFLLIPGGAELIGENENEENDMYDGPDIAFQFEYDRTKDPATGLVPDKQLLVAIDQTSESKETDARLRGIQLPTEQVGHRLLQDETKGVKAGTKGRESRIKDNGEPSAPLAPSVLTWTERGPNSDSAGPQGNSRPNNDITSGRFRSILVDAADPTKKTVLVGGVDGGIWKTTHITVRPATWTPLSETLSNLAVSDIVQDPVNPNILYFGTGEGYRNADAVRGNGIFKSIDGGVNWSYLSSTSSFIYTTRLVIDQAGNLYAGTRASGGLYRSIDGGSSWTNITPAGIPSVDVCDLEISSTGRLHVTFGTINATNSYRFTDISTTVAPGTWTSATTPFTVSPVRTEIAVSGNTLYAAPVDNTTNYQVPTLFKSTDGGANWTSTITQP